MKLLNYPLDTLIIQRYWPTSEADEKKMEIIYKRIEQVYEEIGTD